MKNLNARSQSQRILARRLAREISKEELAVVSGGGHCSSIWSSSDIGDGGGGDDGGADD